jgi:hypothetical protein
MKNNARNEKAEVMKNNYADKINYAFQWFEITLYENNRVENLTDR